MTHRGAYAYTGTYTNGHAHPEPHTKLVSKPDACSCKGNVDGKQYVFDRSGGSSAAD